MSLLQQVDAAGQLPLSGLAGKLAVLRALDSQVDFSRGILQLKIVLALAESDGGYTVRELARMLGQRYKSVSDAMRKLELKGLVARVRERGEAYRLTEKGKMYYERLLAILGVTEGEAARTRIARRMLILDMAKDITLHRYLADAVLAAALSSRKEVSLSELAAILKLSPARAQSYIDMYAEGAVSPRLFKKYHKESRVRAVLAKMGLRVSQRQVYYRLTSDGESLYYKLPDYLKYKNSRRLRLFQKLVGHGHPVLVHRRLSRLFASGSIVLLLLTALGAVPKLVLAPWLLAGSVLWLLASQ
ncbi:MAG: MarR family transcriptional regulator [Thermoproteota archaeon]